MTFSPRDRDQRVRDLEPVPSRSIIASLQAAEGLVAQASPYGESAVIGLRHAQVAEGDIAAIHAARRLTATPGQPPV